MPLKPLFTDKDISKVFDRFEERTDKILLETMKYAGEYFVKIARDEKTDEGGNKITDYRDITGNLRSSVGYIVLKDGKSVAEGFKVSGRGMGGSRGMQQGKKLARELGRTHDKGYVLIGLAGMNYAVFVENMKNKDVISFASKATQQMLKQLITKIKK